MDNYKLMVNNTKEKPLFKLFDIAHNFDETNDLSTKEPRKLKKMYNQILKLRKANITRYKDNQRKIGKHINLDARRKKLINSLKSLGYIHTKTEQK